mmetsp:Transcript_27943/g.41260  ORF Transcript_27943/g.41260 Transcript_27943/m.41260 type:complete len:907 (+) Transcript_27943:274-2994(+)|eukprot:CAMPEP_0194215904 /NCGR_PEP_ID=MMETSP0156-20130528/18018_1 /TAXON_ID=33649 /ORGANISM="Thalassionema nitzschioides, Strain L26-B" /LENGTH=906 /DNA_ID=CAMNT_0038944547 /DNA_START=193 /DNA_END=2913 /DNA_ORIENTATION=+
MVGVELVPSLRIALHVDLANVLTTWLDAVNQGYLNITDDDATTPEFSSAECQYDFQRLSQLRSHIGEKLLEFRNNQDNNNVDNEQQELESLLFDYYACLNEFETRGFPSSSGLTTALEWKSSSGSTSSHKGFLWERCCVLWNLASLETWKGSKQDHSKRGWVQANKSYQMAFSYMGQLNELLSSNNTGKNNADFQLHMVSFWEHVLQAKAQMAAYEKSASMNRPRQMLLAKLAQGAVHLWKQAEESMHRLLQQQQEQLAYSSGSGGSSSLEQLQMLQHYALLAQVWSRFTNCQAEYHESIVHQEKDQVGEQLARLELSLQHGNACIDFLDTGEVVGTDMQIRHELPKLLEKVEDVYNTLLTSGASISSTPELREIRPELVSKARSKLPPAMDSVSISPPLFANLMGPAGRSAIVTFHQIIDRSVTEMTELAEQNTNEARKELARVNLPHSLAAYEQGDAGGIPKDLWSRVDTMQKSNRISLLKRDLWNLRDMAEQAQHVFSTIQNQLQEDVDMHSLFRMQHADYQGTDVKQIQVSFRQALGNYESLLQKSQEGDKLLLTRLEKLDQDPKYKLIQFSKSQLDRLLPGNNQGSNDNNDYPYNNKTEAPVFDTAPLSRLLVELSNLLHERDMTLLKLRQTVRECNNIQSSIAGINPDSPSAAEEYEAAVQLAHKKAISPLEHELRVNLKEQQQVLKSILQQNASFVAARNLQQQQRSNNNNNHHTNNNHNSAPSGTSCIAMIEDALDEMDTLTKHLTEGKHFYNVVIPKLEQLKQQVSNASARLTADRCEYAESYSTKRLQQEEEDARMAKALAQQSANASCTNNNNTNTANNNPDENGSEQNNQNNNNNNSPHSHPGFVHVDHTEPQVRVDDEKVASLIAMDFDPDKVVRALVKYDNDVEAALNELIS